MAKKNVAKRVEQRRARKQLNRQHRLSKRNRAGTPVWRRPQPKALRPTPVTSLLTTTKASARVRQWNMQLAAMLALCVTCVLAFSIPACGGVRSRPLSFREQSVEITSVPKDAVFYLDDIQGSPVAEVDATGEVLSRTDYHPYGHVRYQSGKAGDPWGYVGNEEDRGSSVSDFHARPYRPELGAFLAVDPVALLLADKSIKEPFREFAYSYGAGNPLSYIDASGKTISIAYEDERRQVLTILQNLSSDKLTVDKSGKVQIASFGEGEYASGTSLVRALISHRKDVSIVGKSGLELPNTTEDGSQIVLGTTEIPIWQRERGTGIAVQAQIHEFIVLGHELIHALHVFTKTQGNSPLTQTSQYRSDGKVRTYTEKIEPEEAKTVCTGRGPRYGANEVTENDLRREHGIAERVFYNGPKVKE